MSSVDLLLGSSLLRSLSESDLEELAARARRSTYSADELIFRKGDSGNSMMVVVTGRVKIVSVSGSGTEVILSVIDRGEVFGEISLLDGEPRSADAVATKTAEILSLDRRDFLPVLYRNREALERLMKLLCGRIRQVSTFVENVVFLDAETRLLQRLRALAAQYGRPEPDGSGLRIQHGFSQQELGDSVGLTRVSINRHLARWRERGLIRTGRGYIVISDLKGLEAAVKPT
jgi:CRP-like cAMP-binding protein